MQWRFMFVNTRSRVYLLWAVLTGIGYVATHYYQRRQANALWAVISIIGLGYMARVMPLRVRQMRLIFLSWLVPIALGLFVSFLVFVVPSLSGLIGYLGVFWLFVMAMGYIANGIYDEPVKWYAVATICNIAAAFACIFSKDLLQWQYIVSAVVSSGSMLLLWFKRQ